jgi:hypothetical protein
VRNTHREEYRLKAIYNTVLRKIVFGLKRDEVTEVGESCIMRSAILHTI